MSKMNYNRPSFRDPSRVYESIDGSDIPEEFRRGTRRYAKWKSKAELRREADEAWREFNLKKRNAEELWSERRPSRDQPSR
jgi:hypothetical protein